mmetsp:Transcript_16814/g.36426  ORF Transcript_16814/g.36426 Transcript_16814/m.36426 type:complete len:218 (-) Transcript_16814:302-955(-)|eukprot:CAMPEP_0183357230 /NCGR_PEP_ID=MMETSP0164_2-20130417/45661_1 /TAXON_ID=221442 /ORGANISM="Coccolithus pelagicus ssp braarudi, Strain PLY182g" /LENGTH=217 /DNA_ID=CAMNT_0025530805 /DNA_START=286 /DNA_END=939 /DNA_ORIENTATION=-
MVKAAQVIDSAGALVIAVFVSLCSIVAQVQHSAIGVCTLSICGAILTPFIFVGSLILGLGVMCCIPVIIIGVGIVWLPTLAHVVVETLSRRTRRLTSWVPSAKRLMHEQPMLVTGAVLGVLMLSPLVVGVLLLACFWYLLFAPVTLPLTVYVCWKITSATKRHVKAGDHHLPLKPLGGGKEAKRPVYEDDHFEATSPPPSEDIPSEMTADFSQGMGY